MQGFIILVHNPVFLNVSLAGRQDIQLELLSFTICRGASQHMNRQGLPPSSSPGGEDRSITGFLLSAVKEHLCHEEITRQTNLCFLIFFIKKNPRKHEAVHTTSRSLCSSSYQLSEKHFQSPVLSQSWVWETWKHWGIQQWQCVF